MGHKTLERQSQDYVTHGGEREFLIRHAESMNSSSAIMMIKCHVRFIFRRQELFCFFNGHCGDDEIRVWGHHLVFDAIG